MSWYTTLGSSPDHVLFSKVRYIRNEAKRNFYHMLDSKRAQETLNKLNSLLTSNGFRGEAVTQGISPAMLSLCEKQLIESDFAKSDRPRALYLNEPCNLVVAIGGRDLISISSVTSGLSVIEAENMASKAEELIDRELTFAYNDKIGYLSPAPSSVGSGLTFSAALYLPSLKQIGFEKVRQGLAMHSISLFPMFLSTADRSDLYILSYTPHFLANEDAATVFFSDTVSGVVAKEKERIGIIFREQDKIIYERARRALGYLLYSESITEGEMLEKLSEIRLSLCISKDSASKELPGVQDINYLCAEGLNSSVTASAKERCATQEDCDILRAELIKKYINHKSEAV